jgi:hypothetical protein
MAVLVSAAFAAVDKAFPAIVGAQPQKAAGFRASGMASMRDYLNLSLQHQVAGLTMVLIVMGLFFGMLGACGAAERRQASRSVRNLPPAARSPWMSTGSRGIRAGIACIRGLAGRWCWL